jgi:hypothetical protein
MPATRIHQYQTLDRRGFEFGTQLQIVVGNDVATDKHIALDTMYLYCKRW